MSQPLVCPECEARVHLPEESQDDLVKCQACGYVFATADPQSVWQIPAAFDGVVGGMLAGILTGVIVGALAGAFRDGPGAAFGGLVFGVVVGFALGALCGVAAAVLGKLAVPALTRPRLACLTAGFCGGAAVAAVVARGVWLWLVPGVVVGVVAANYWSRLRHRLSV